MPRNEKRRLLPAFRQANQCTESSETKALLHQFTEGTQKRWSSFKKGGLSKKWEGGVVGSMLILPGDPPKNCSKDSEGLPFNERPRVPDSTLGTLGMGGNSAAAKRTGTRIFQPLNQGIWSGGVGILFASSLNYWWLRGFFCLGGSETPSPLGVFQSGCYPFCCLIELLGKGGAPSG